MFISPTRHRDLEHSAWPIAQLLGVGLRASADRAPRLVRRILFNGAHDGGSVRNGSVHGAAVGNPQQVRALLRRELWADERDKPRELVNFGDRFGPAGGSSSAGGRGGGLGGQHLLMVEAHRDALQRIPLLIRVDTNRHGRARPKASQNKAVGVGPQVCAAGVAERLVAHKRVPLRNNVLHVLARAGSRTLAHDSLVRRRRPAPRNSQGASRREPCRNAKCH
eukprot:Amastigsp_a510654_38.p1 type:complete len:222 gc:universal Amastigsp_a510654_38:2-667(+)